jgi:hypothetical protein
VSIKDKHWEYFSLSTSPHSYFLNKKIKFKISEENPTPAITGGKNPVVGPGDTSSTMPCSLPAAFTTSLRFAFLARRTAEGETREGEVLI